MNNSPVKLRKRGYAHHKITSDKASIKWTLDNFLSWADSKPLGFILDSPIFSFEFGSANETHNFLLKLHPRGAGVMEAEDDENEALGIFLYSKNPGKITTEASFVFLTKDKKVLFTNEFAWTFEGSGKGYGFEAVSKETLKDCGLLPDDPLTIQCTITVKISESSAVTYETPPPPEKHSKTVLGDFAYMFADQAFLDFEIVCQEKSFPCHKAVLAARSEVFKKMLNTDGEEAKKNCLVIKDFENEQVGQLLQFIYTGSLKEEDSIGTDLLLLADKYDLPDLVHICEVTLARDVNHELPLEASLGILDIANRISSDYLIKACSAFLAKNRMKLMWTSEWTRIAKENPGALISVFKEIP